jgi:hypothetical protein
VNWGMLSFGKGQLMLNMHGSKGRHDVALWFYIEKVDELYDLLKSRQIEAAQAGRDGIEFIHEIYDPFYGGREFGIRDLNGYELWFRQD